MSLLDGFDQSKKLCVTHSTFSMNVTEFPKRCHEHQNNQNGINKQKVKILTHIQCNNSNP